MRQRLRRAHRQALHDFQCRAFDVLHELPAVAVVGEDREREMSRRYQLDEQTVPKGAAVRRRQHAADRAQVPSNPHVIVGAGLVHAGRAHQLE